MVYPPCHLFFLGAVLAGDFHRLGVPSLLRQTFQKLVGGYLQVLGRVAVASVLASLVAPRCVTTERAARILRGIRPQGASACLRRRLASEILRDLRTLDRKVADLNGRIESEVEASDTTLTQIFGHRPGRSRWGPSSSLTLASPQST